MHLYYTYVVVGRLDQKNASPDLNISLFLPKKTINIADNIWSKNEFTYT